MSQTPSTFRKKPVEIQAMQWDGTATGGNAIIDWVLAGGGTARFHCEDSAKCLAGDEGHTLAIDTLEGTMHAQAGDWIIRGVQGEHYPCKPDIFEATYDAAESPPPPCPNHRENQHRDGKPPWCKACGWTHGHPATPPQNLRDLPSPWPTDGGHAAQRDGR